MTQESYNNTAVVLSISAFRSMRKAELTNTSAMECMKTINYVEEEVQSRIRTRRIRHSMTIVLARRNGTKRAVAEKSCESAAMELLSKGNKFQVEEYGDRVESSRLEDFKPTGRSIIVEFGLVNFDPPKTINSPSSTTFPVVAFLLQFCSGTARRRR